MCYYECAIMEVETKFKVLNQEHSLEYDRNPIESIKTRVKSYESILKKIRKNDIPITMEAIEENIKDIAGVRVICSFQDDIYALEESFLKQDDIELIERKDYIKNSQAERIPQPSSDCSGSDLFCRIQRSLSMWRFQFKDDRDGFLGKS